MSNYLKDYDFSYPPELVAQHPLQRRGDSRMMVVSVQEQNFRHAKFQALPQFLKEGDLVLVNDTRVLASRLFARKPTGGLVEVFLLHSIGPLEWSVFFSPARGLQEGMELPLWSRRLQQEYPVKVTVSSLAKDDFRVCFADRQEEQAALQEYGEMPLPPYIKRPQPEAEDRERYQTIYAHRAGAVAAPTAGLHFTPEMKKQLEGKGVQWASLTLHVGEGTFLPIKTEDINSHPMHREWYQIPATTLEAIEVCQSRGGKVVAVGTTTLRALESYGATSQREGWTDLFIRPGFSFQLVDGLLTNFHQPRSTLFVLVSALAGREFMSSAYQAAMAEQYRLFSYGDCMLIWRS